MAVLVIPVICLSLASPAMGAPLPAPVVGAADEAMVTLREARSLGIDGKAIRAFSEIFGQREAVDDPWLCDLDGAVEVEGIGARNELQVEIFSRWESGYIVENELHAYRDEAEARKAYRLIRDLAPSCEGTVTSNEDRGRVTYRLTNGKGETAQGRSFVWTYSRAVSADNPLDFRDNYITFTRIGSYVQVVELESLGERTGNLSSTQRRDVRKLTGVLADRATEKLP